MNNFRAYTCVYFPMGNTFKTVDVVVSFVMCTANNKNNFRSSADLDRNVFRRVFQRENTNIDCRALGGKRLRGSAGSPTIMSRNSVTDHHDENNILRENTLRRARCLLFIECIYCVEQRFTGGYSRCTDVDGNNNNDW